MTITRLPDLHLDTTTGVSRIVVGASLRDDLGRLVREHWPAATTAWLISDDGVLPHYGDVADAALGAAGLQVRARAVPAGEASKSLEQVSLLYDWLLTGGVSRGDIVVALGGGMVGDLAGFVAATCLRGLALVQAPTSLLAMVDSSVGGKTGVNHVAGKNLIGAFNQPGLVVVDPTVLTTLSARELRSGWGEVIKYGFIEQSVPGAVAMERPLLTWLEQEADAFLSLHAPVTAQVIHRCIDLKVQVVRVDPTEQGIRAILNFGHTAGHAVEAASGYGRVLHGEAVALGMRVATAIGHSTGRCDAALVERQQALIHRFGLPQTADQLTTADLWPFMRRDKKAEAGALRWILPREPGEVEIARGIDDAIVEQALALIVEPAAT